MKTAIIYYSYEGSCALVAGIIKAALNADIYEIKTKDAKKRTGFFKYVWGGSQVVMRRKPALKPLAVDPESYDLIILGTPVWASSPSPAMISFLGRTKISGKKLALFCCHAGGKGQVFEKLKVILAGNNIAGEIDFINPAGMDQAVLKQEISEWAKTICA